MRPLDQAGPLANELYEICLLNERQTSSELQTNVSLRLSALMHKVDELEARHAPAQSVEGKGAEVEWEAKVEACAVVIHEVNQGANLCGRKHADLQEITAIIKSHLAPPAASATTEGETVTTPVHITYEEVSESFKQGMAELAWAAVKKAVGDLDYVLLAISQTGGACLDEVPLQAKRAREELLPIIKRHLAPPVSLAPVATEREPVSMSQHVRAYLNAPACCSGQDCACRGVTRLQQFVQEEAGTQLDALRKEVERLKGEQARILDRVAGYITHNDTDGPAERKVADMQADRDALRGLLREAASAINQSNSSIECLAASGTSYPRIAENNIVLTRLKSALSGEPAATTKGLEGASDTEMLDWLLAGNCVRVPNGNGDGYYTAGLHYRFDRATIRAAMHPSHGKEGK